MDNQKEEEIIQISELEDEALLSGYDDNQALFDVVHDYLKSISRFPLLSNEETKELFIKYQTYGDLEAREKLIYHNLRLVVWYIKKFKHVTKSYEFIDMIQTGNIGLINAVDNFDLSKGASLSTYIIKCVGNILHSELANNDRTIRFPAYLVKLMIKYRKYINNYYNKYGEYPDDDKICAFLEIKPNKLKEIRENLANVDNLDSLNRQLTDEDNATLEDFVEDNTVTGYEDFEKIIDDKILCYNIKKLLDSESYYIIYHTILSPNKIVLRELAVILDVTYQRVQQIYSKAIEKIKRSKVLMSKIQKKIKDISNLDIRPIDFKKKAILLYLKSRITPDEYNYLFDIYYMGLSPSAFIRKNHISKETFDEFANYMNDNYGKYLFPSNEIYLQILSDLKTKYTVSQIFDLDITSKVDNSFAVKETLDSLSKDELISVIGADYENLTKEQKMLIDDYYDNQNPHIYNAPINLINAKVNLALLGYKGDKGLNLSVLYKTYLANKDIFDTDYQKYLEGTIFRDITGKKVPYDSVFAQRKNITLLRLAQLYYKLDNYFTYEIPESEIKRIITKYDYLFSKDEIKAIKLYYLNPEGNLNIRELMAVFNIQEKFEMLNLLRVSYNRIISLYLGIYKRFIIKNEDIYMQYVNDPTFIMVPLNREVCRLRFQEHLDYKEIGKLLGISSTQKVSNILGKAIFFIDCHHYNVTNETIYEEDKIYHFFEKKPNYMEMQKEIIIKRYVENKTSSELTKEYSITPREYISIVDNFNIAYVTFYADKNLSKDDVAKEIFAHSSDCVLNENQKAVLSYVYGVKCPYNPEGLILTKYEIIDKLQIDENIYVNSRRVGQDLLGGKKNGIVGSPLGRLTQEEVRECLKDPNIPLTPDEKNLLRAIKGIDCETKTIEDIAKEDNVNNYSVRRRVLRCYVNILKYQEGLHDKIIDYDTDVLPRLKYFPLIEQMQLIDIYRDHLDVNAFMKKYNITKHYAWTTIERLEKRLYYIIKYRPARKFDFDYAREVLDKEDLPYYGDYELAHKFYNRYFGDDGQLPDSRGDLIDDLNIREDFKTSAMVRNLMVACLMYKDGYRKPNTISISEIKDYYESHKDSIPASKHHLYTYSIKQKELTKVNETVAYEILKERGENIFNIEDITPSQALKLIRENPYKFTDAQLEHIRHVHKIPKRDIMSGKNKHKLYKLVAPYVLKREEPAYKLAYKK